MFRNFFRTYLHSQNVNIALALQRCFLTHFKSIDVNINMGDKNEKSPDEEKETEASTSTKVTTLNEIRQAAEAQQTDCEDEEDPETMELVKQFFAQKFGIGNSGSASEGPKKVIENLTFNGLTEHWKTNGLKKIITMVGAGISTSAGIPDFRSPGSGIYDNLQKYNLPHPAAIFDMDYFEVNPRPFFALAKELYPGTFYPTISHYFVRLLHEKGLLVRHYTQNIDTLERIACIPAEKLVEAHGTFYTNHCLKCRKLYSMAWMKTEIFADRLPVCTESNCKGTVKPDIVFFGENLPETFYELPEKDFKDCDLLIIMGTSLEVQPFASLVNRVGDRCMRLLINREKVGQLGSGWFSGGGHSLRFDTAMNWRDVAYIGDCDDGVLALAKGLGWEAELKELMKSDHARLSKSETEKQAPKESRKSTSSEKSPTKTSDDKGKAPDEPHKA